MPDERYARLPPLRDNNETENKARNGATGKPKGRPCKYSDEIAAEICERLAAGESLNQICRDPHMPDQHAVRVWALDNRAGFSPRYARARELQAEYWADEIVDITDNEPDPVRARVRMDGRKWITSKLLPRKYGDKVEVSGDPDRPLVQISRIEIVAVEPGSLAPPPKVIDHED